MADTYGDTYPGPCPGPYPDQRPYPAAYPTAYPEAWIALPSNPHVVWNTTQCDITTTFGFDITDRLPQFSPPSISFDTSTAGMTLPPPYHSGAWVYLCELQEKAARLEQELAALRALLAKTPDKDEANNALTQGEPRQIKEGKPNKCSIRKYHRRPKVRNLV